MDSKEHFRKLKDFFNTLTLEKATAENLREFYTEDVHCTDPFYDAHGMESLVKVFQDLYKKMPDCHFIISEYAVNEEKKIAFGEWTITYTQKGKTKTIKGATVSRYNDELKIYDDANFWDGKVMYEELPILGSLLRMIRERFIKYTKAT